MAYAERLMRSEHDAAQLRGTRCADCGRHAFPPRSVCSACGAQTQEPAWLSGRGTVHAYSAVCTPPAGFSEPYLFCAVDLDEGPRTFGILTEQPTGAGRVVAVPAPLRDGVPGFAFAPAP